MSEDFKILNDYQHSRLKTEMYLGSRAPLTQSLVYDENNIPFLKDIRWVPALYTAFREILDNACDEVIGRGFGNRIDVEYNPETYEITIEDNGRGIPIDFNKDRNMHVATMAVVLTKAGTNFGERGTVGGTNGIGAAAVSSCSEYFKLEVKRGGQKFTQEFKEAHAAFDEDLIIGKPKLIKYSGEHTGTKITFKPSKRVFEEIPKLKDNMLLPEEFIRSRVLEIALSNPKVKFYYNGSLIKVKPKLESSLFNDNAIVVDIKQGTFHSSFYLVPDWADDSDYYHTVVNNIYAFNGGSHVDAFKRTFYKNLLAALAKEGKKRKLVPNNADIQSGLLVYNITKMDAPNFDSQSKTRLTNDNAANIIKKYLEDEEVYKTIIKKNKSWIEQIFERCAIRTQKKDSSDISKLSKKLLKAKVAGLNDANGKDRSKCILFLAEGLSAISGMASVRNPEIHGGMGLKGKVKNICECAPKEIFDNKELSDIMNSLGIVIGKKAIREDLRYGKVYLAADMDPDGANIVCLLINFFYNFWPELFDANQEPVFYSFQTPFIIANKGKERKYWYAFDYENFNPQDYKGWAITRAKGLGTLTNEDWKHSLENPTVIPIIDDGELKPLLNLLFNKKLADERKNWMGI